jgi:tRNA (guanosine-2'-O-)-methyltransferase
MSGADEMEAAGAQLERFPYSGEYEVAGQRLSAAQVIALLGGYITEPRRDTIDRVVRGRTWTVTVVFESPYDRGNVSAVMRSAEGLGYGSLHVIETNKRFKQANRATAGTDKWLEVERWPQTAPCVEQLKARGYQLVATHLDETAVPISQIDFTRPTALILGNEHAGVSEEMLAASDHRCIVPMAGFAQSFNISVAAAISLYHIQQAREAAGGHADLSAAQIEALRAEYYWRALERPEQLITGELERRGLPQL